MIANTQEAYDYRKGFRELYFSKLAPKLSQFEIIRRSKKPVYIALKSFFVLSAVISVSTFLYLEYYSKIEKSEPSSIIFVAFFLSLIFAILSWAWAHKIKKDFENFVKEKTLKIFLSFFGVFRWTFKESRTQQQIRESKLVDSFNIFSADDYFEGTHRGLKIVISEVELKYESGSGENRTVREVFDGVFVQIDMNKRFQTQTVITSNNAFKSFFSKLFDSEMQPVELEDIEFNKLFDVYSTNQIEARYLITPSFMERFKALKAVYKTSDIRASFLDNKITLAIPKKEDMFVLGDISKPVDDGGQVQKLFDEFVSVLSLIDLLKLDSKTGL